MEVGKTYTVRAVHNATSAATATATAIAVVQQQQPRLQEQRQQQYVNENAGPQRTYVQVRRPVVVQQVVTAGQPRPASSRLIPAPSVSSASSQEGQSQRRFIRSPPASVSSANQLRYDFDFDDPKRCEDKSMGLRHFSTKVCEKVKEKGRTNYNEVADELVNEYFDSQKPFQVNDEKHQYDMKNIRRRVYDALNVLIAMNIIQKNNKDLLWLGLPTSTAQEFKQLADGKQRRQERIKEKTQNLQDLIIQLVAYRSLVEKNKTRERQEGRPDESSILYLPYVIVNTEKRATVDCQIASDKSEFLFTFDHPFEIHDDVDILKRLGLAHGIERGMVPAELSDKIKGYLPPALRDYVDQIMQGHMGGMREHEKDQVHYNAPQQSTAIISEAVDEKPTLITGRSANFCSSSQRAPVVIARTVPDSKHTFVKPPANGARTVTPPRRNAQMMLRSQGGASPIASRGHGHYVQQGQHAATQFLRAAQQQQTRNVLPQYAYENQEDLDRMYEEVYDDLNDEENVEYAQL